MPLVTPLSIDSDDEVAKLAEVFNETLGYCPNSVLTMMRRPPIARAFIELNKAVMENKGRVTSALKRLIGYVASNAAGCRYCQAHTIRAAERYGAEKEKLENVWEYRSHPAFTEAERVALDLALAASTNAARPTSPCTSRISATSLSASACSNSCRTSGRP